MQKGIIKYMISDFKASMITFILVVLGITIFFVPVSFVAESVSFNGAGLACLIFMFIVALSILPTGIRYMNQSGFSRKTAYKNFIASFAIFSLVLSLFVQLLILVFNLFTLNNIKFESEYNLLYGGSINNTFFPSIIWLFLAIFFISSIAFFISMLYQKMGKSTKIGVSFGVPVFFLIVFPLIDSVLLEGKVYSALLKGIMFICGFYNGESYPLLAMGMFLLLSIIIYGITYFLLVRRLNFK